MRGDAEDWVSIAANSILSAIVAEAAIHDVSGPFTLDDLLRAWLEHDPATVARLPDPPGTSGASVEKTRTYWFYEGCHALEEGAWIAEVGGGKFAVASLTSLVARARQEASTHSE
ncbi:MAG TPA: hypothetical protein VLZ77_17365 [Acidimicrobiales bacterium]|nr:hypothetical protein [Acidimicrobiales bacterium]